jgi:hypothetical protein
VNLTQVLTNVRGASWVLIKPDLSEVILPETCMPAEGAFFPGINAEANGVAGSNRVYYTGDARKSADFLKLVGGHLARGNAFDALSAATQLDADLAVATRVEVRFPQGTLGWDLDPGYSHIRQEKALGGAGNLVDFQVWLAVNARAPVVVPPAANEITLKNASIYTISEDGGDAVISFLMNNEPSEIGDCYIFALWARGFEPGFTTADWNSMVYEEPAGIQGQFVGAGGSGVLGHVTFVEIDVTAASAVALQQYLSIRIPNAGPGVTNNLIGGAMHVFKNATRAGVIALETDGYEVRGSPAIGWISRFSPR